MSLVKLLDFIMENILGAHPCFADLYLADVLVSMQLLT
jgi:hypothetical protein